MDNHITKKLLTALSLATITYLLLSLSVSGLAAPVLQLTPFLTPTPGSDGRIIYIVQPNDTLIRISLISGVSQDELRGLNNLTGDTIVTGQELLLGLGGPSRETPTPGPSPTPTVLLPTPSPSPGTGNLCVLLFNDRNGDSIRQEEEPSIPNGAISVSNRSGTVSMTAETEDGLDPYCFEQLDEGDYTVTVAVPEGYNPTTVTNYALTLEAGDETYLDFGAQANSVTLEEEALVPTGGGKSPLLGIVGAVFLLAGIGLGIFAVLMLKGVR